MTRLEHLHTLPEPIRTKAISNALRENRINAQREEADTLARSVDLLFTWGETPQGSGYWEDVTAALDGTSPFPEPTL